MNVGLQRSITAGVVVQTQGGHRCRVCDKESTEIDPHLQGKDHQNNLAWETLRNPNPHQFLFKALSSVVREAKQRGELELVDKAHFSYRCLVCTRRPVVNGIKPLETHLNGNEHKKAKKMMAVSPNSHPAPSPTYHPQVPPSSQPSNPYPTLASSNTHFPLYQPPRDEPSSRQQQQYPSTCNLPQYPSYDHPHKTPAPLPPSQSPTYYSTHQPPYTSTAGASHSNAPLQPAVVPLEAKGYDSELQRALTAGVVAEVPREGGLPSFKCRACDKDFNGTVPCSDHLSSDKHKKKAQAWTPQPQAPTPQPQTQTPQPQTWTPQPGPDIAGQTPQDRRTRSLFDALPIDGKRNDQGDGPRKFRWTVVTGTRPVPPSDLVYRNFRGLVLIFNYFTGQGEHKRPGASMDSFNLTTLFDRMGYQVYLYEDYSKSKTEEQLSHTQNSPCLKDYDSFIVFILSHGRDDQVFFTTSFNEEDSMRLDDVRYKFSDTACPLLSGKPKLFFVNFCRARAGEQRTDYDGMAPHNPGPKNIVTVYSCINTFMSPRDPENGTFFVQAWCEVLAAHAHNEELRDLYDHACHRLEAMKGPVPELQIYFFKKFYFNPGR